MILEHAGLTKTDGCKVWIVYTIYIRLYIVFYYFVCIPEWLIIHNYNNSDFGRKMNVFLLRFKSNNLVILIFTYELLIFSTVNYNC